MGSGCGSVGSADTSDTRDPRFESRYLKILFAINYIKSFFEKTKIIGKESGNGQF